MTAEVVYRSDSEQHTQTFGRWLAECLQPGITVALNGQLGSGKTRLVRAVCEALGADVSRVNSPTFVLLQSYPEGRLPVFHFDTYRLADVEEFLAIGADEFLNDPTAVCFVEWADRVREVLPADHLVLQIEQLAATVRRLQLTPTGPRSTAIVQHLQTLID